MAHGDRIQVTVPDARFDQRCTDDRHDPLQVCSAGDLGDDPAVALVQLMLCGNDVGQYVAPIAHDGGGRFVTARLDPEDEWG